MWGVASFFWRPVEKSRQRRSHCSEDSTYPRVRLALLALLAALLDRIFEQAQILLLFLVLRQGHPALEEYFYSKEEGGHQSPPSSLE